METILFIYAIPNLVIGIVIGVVYVRRFIDLYSAPNTTRYPVLHVLSEILTTLLSPFIGFAMLFEDETYRDLKVNWIGREEVQMIILLYVALILIYWVLSRDKESLKIAGRNFIFTFITASLLLITLLGAGICIYSNGYMVGFFPGFGFPVIAIFLNLILYSYRLAWAKATLNASESHHVIIDNNHENN